MRNFSNNDKMEETGVTVNDSEEKSLTVKVICIGDSAVGKSKLIERYLVDDYVPLNMSTYALTLFHHKTKVGNKPVSVDIWDTAGQEMFQTVHPTFFHQAHAGILVFDATRKATYTNLKSWYAELRQHRPHIPVFCAVNKIDANMEVTKVTFAFAQKNLLPVYYVSAADGTNVVKLFRDAIEAAVEYKNNPPDFVDQVMQELEKM